MKSRRAAAILVASLGGISASGRLPDAFSEHHAALVAKNPPQVSLALQSDRRSYFQGQRIGLTLRFSAAAAGLYAVDNAGYDRSGRLSIDQFRVDRIHDAVDPLAEWFRRPSIGGGLHGFDDLDATVDVGADLNEWLRFDRPGRYRVYAVSSRVAYRTTWRPLEPVTSSIVEFEIVPADPAWAAQSLSRASATIDRIAAHVATRPMTYGGAAAIEPDLARAARTLRFLGTPDAARALVRYLAADAAVIASRSDGPMFDRSWELVAGLAASPHRDLVVTTMRQRAAEQPAVSPRFRDTLAWLERP